jgi:hypothetical protein
VTYWVVCTLCFLLLLCFGAIANQPADIEYWHGRADHAEATVTAIARTITPAPTSRRSCGDPYTYYPC